MSFNYIYDNVSKYYDMMYVNEESYKAEVDKVVLIASEHNIHSGANLLDIACGTGVQAALFQDYYHVTGIDLNESMMEIAREKVKSAEFINADMFNFNLSKQFDIIVNLYGSIGHAETYEQLCSSIECVNRHLRTSGIFILTPWSTKESISSTLITKSKSLDLSGFCRMETVTRLSDDKVIVEMHHLVSDNLNVSYHKHIQTITLFSEDEYVNSINRAGLKLLTRLSPKEFRMGAFVCTK